MGRPRQTTWVGGRIRYDREGVPTYEVRKVVQTETGPVRVEFSTLETDLRRACDVFDKFKADPTYRPGAEVQSVAPSAVLMTDGMIDNFLVWSAKPKNEGGKANLKPWIANKRLYLRWWQVLLAGKDLRKIPTSYLAEYLDGNEAEGVPAAKSRGHRIAVLKHFYSWLRKTKHLVKHREDPTLDLQKPPVAPAQRTKRKSHTQEEIDLVKKHLHGVWLWGFNVDLATGWHVSEIFRFAHEGGTVQPYAGPDPEKQWVLTSPRGKGGEVIKTAVTGEVAAQAMSLLDVDNPSVESRLDIYNQVWMEPISVVARRSGCSDVALANLCRNFGIPTPPRGYWQKKAVGLPVAKDPFFPEYFPNKNRRHTFNRRGYATALRKASKAAGIDPPFLPGQVRHTVATFAMNAGADLASISTFLNHKSPKTTKDFYATLGVPGTVPTPESPDRKDELQ